MEETPVNIMSMPKQTSEDRELRVRLTALARADDGPMVGEVPESWLLNPKFRCVNFHVANRFETARRQRRVCVFCSLPVQPTFPDDRSGPLPSTSTLIPSQPVAPRLEETTDDVLRIEEGSLYPALYRLEKSGWTTTDAVEARRA